MRGDCDLETCRLYIDRLQEASSPPFMFITSAPDVLLFLPRHHYFTTPTTRERRVSAGRLSAWTGGTSTLWLFVNLETRLLCLLGFTPGAIYWPQGALPGTTPVSPLNLCHDGSTTAVYNQTFRLKNKQNLTVNQHLLIPSLCLDSLFYSAK